MTNFKDDLHRHSLRLPLFDYSTEGYYFITLCTNDNLRLFGSIRDNEMILNKAGNMIENIWHMIHSRFPLVYVDSYCIMPNHFHGILEIRESEENQSPSLSEIMYWFKSFTTNSYMQGVRNENWYPFSQRLWLRNYYEHIVRSEKELWYIREYIHQNVSTWEEEHDEGMLDLKRILHLHEE